MVDFEARDGMLDSDVTKVIFEIEVCGGEVPLLGLCEFDFGPCMGMKTGDDHRGCGLQVLMLVGS